LFSCFASYSNYLRFDFTSTISFFIVLHCLHWLNTSRSLCRASAVWFSAALFQQEGWTTRASVNTSRSLCRASITHHTKLNKHKHDTSCLPPSPPGPPLPPTCHLALLLNNHTIIVCIDVMFHVRFRFHLLGGSPHSFLFLLFHWNQIRHTQLVFCFVFCYLTCL
jgi:hypothetical protein